jgi:SNF2 family DNA or RNA helicase
VTTEQWVHQRAAVEFMAPLGSGMLAMEMGTGKTRVALDLLVEWDSALALVVCPRSVLGVWRSEAEKHYPGQWRVFAPERGDTAWRAREVEKAVALEQARRSRLVVAINYEAVNYERLGDALLRQQWDAVVFDESHRIKAVSGETSLWCAKLGKQVRHRLALTGTPMPQSPLDVYAQFRAVDRSVFGWSFAAFKANYADEVKRRARSGRGLRISEAGEQRPGMVSLLLSPGHFTHRRTTWRLEHPKAFWLPVNSESWVFLSRDGEVRFYRGLGSPQWRRGAGLAFVGKVTTDGLGLVRVDNEEADFWFEYPVEVQYKNLEDLHERMYARTFRVRADDVLDLPPSVDSVREFDLCDEARQTYDALQRDLCADLEEGRVTARNALTKLLRLQQITSGVVQPDRDEEGPRELLHVDDGKATALREFVEGAEVGGIEWGDDRRREPVVVFCRFKHDLDVVRRLADELEIRHGELSGGRSDLEAFQRGEVDLFGVLEQAGGLGVDLTRARRAVYYSLTWSLGDHDQTRARIRRPGQERPVQYVYLVARDTVDSAILRALQEKREVIDFVVDELRGGGSRRLSSEGGTTET